MLVAAENTLISLLKQLPSNYSYTLSILEYLVNISIYDTTQKKTFEFVFGIDELVHKTHLLAARIYAVLGLNTKIHGRQCSIAKVSAEETVLFLQKNHLLGSVKGTYRNGLFYKGELVAIALFSKGMKMDRLQQEERSFELIRYCNKHNYTVVGGLSKLLSSFIKEKKVGDIMTYIDKEFSEGMSFKKLGFKTIAESTPIQFVIDKSDYSKHTLANLPKNKRAALEQNAEAFWELQNSGNLKMVLHFNQP